MRSERLVVLVSPAEKAQIVERAKQRRTSVGALVRSALTTPGGVGSDGLGDDRAGQDLSPDQIAALERLSDVALSTMRRANAALDRAFNEIEATKAYFASKQR